MKSFMIFTHPHRSPYQSRSHCHIPFAATRPRVQRELSGKLFCDYFNNSDMEFGLKEVVHKGCQTAHNIPKAEYQF